jgi:hypothetical protein
MFFLATQTISDCKKQSKRKIYNKRYQKWYENLSGEDRTREDIRRSKVEDQENLPKIKEEILDEKFKTEMLLKLE